MSLNSCARARLTLADSRERHTIAADIYDRVELRAPQDGIIQNLTVHTLGGVVRPGKTIMEIVPVNDDLIINARISPLDVDSVRTGMEAEVRFSSFTGDEVPTIFGRVEWISADIVIDDVAREEYFLSKIVVDDDSVPERISEALTPGMPGDVIIATGERTTLDYLIQTAREPADQGHEGGVDETDHAAARRQCETQSRPPPMSPRFPGNGPPWKQPPARPAIRSSS